jgi:hypothetical protein
MSALEFQKQMKKKFGLVIKSVEKDKRRIRVYCKGGD